jgi:hypothetical protein
MAHLSIRGEQSDDYFVIFCEQCGNATRNEYLGGDPVVPHFRATCGTCGATTILKLSSQQWAGLPLTL